MIVIELIYKKPIEFIDQHVVAHRAYLDEAYKKGLLLFSGPKKPRNGGFIIAQADKKTMESWIQHDPFYIEEIADYKVTEFSAIKGAPQFSDLLEKA